MAKDTTDDTRNFSIFFLNKHKKLKPETTSSSNSVIWSRQGREVARINYDISTMQPNAFIRLSYRSKRSWETEWTSIDYQVPLELLPCHFGGNRWYFRCPLSKDGQFCGRRVAILYSVSNYFGCRHCSGLTYQTCLESKKMRGFPWKVLTDEWKADEIYKTLRMTHYNGKPTRKYQRCLNLWRVGSEWTNAEGAF